eukprot:8805628-Alexandrium_andersonii.AAC.1
MPEVHIVLDCGALITIAHGALKLAEDGSATYDLLAPAGAVRHVGRCAGRPCGLPRLPAPPRSK